MSIRSALRPSALLACLLLAASLGPGASVPGLPVELLAPPLAAQTTETVRLAGGEVSVHNLAGRVRVVRGTGSEVVVRVTRGGSDGERLRLETGPDRGRSTLRVVYPDDRVVYPAMGDRSRNTTRVTDEGFLGRGGDEVTVRGSGRGMEAWADLVIELPDGRDAQVRLSAGEVEVEDIDGVLLVDTGSGEVRTRGTAGRLTVDTGSGGVEVLGAAGSVFVDTGSGSVRVERISGDRIEVDTGSGGVEGADLQAEELTVDTGSGSIRIRSVTADFVTLDTGSGSVELSLDGDVEELVVDTGSGSVTVDAPASLGAEIELETGSGGIDVDFPVQVRRAGRDYMIGTLGDGGGEIRIDTGSGSIRLRRSSR